MLSGGRRVRWSCDAQLYQHKQTTSSMILQEFRLCRPRRGLAEGVRGNQARRSSEMLYSGSAGQIPHNHMYSRYVVYDDMDGAQARACSWA